MRGGVPGRSQAAAPPSGPRCFPAASTCATSGTLWRPSTASRTSPGRGDTRTPRTRRRFLARSIREDHPIWAYGVGMEAIGLFRARHARGNELLDEAARILSWTRRRRILVVTVDGVAYTHFPCGYGVLAARDAGWTNDLSILGSGLVWAAEFLCDPSALRDAASFAEYFLQPWRPDALGPEGTWRCGTWREDLSSWVVGPSRYSGFESTDARGLRLLDLLGPHLHGLPVQAPRPYGGRTLPRAVPHEPGLRRFGHGQPLRGARQRRHGALRLSRRGLPGR